jgi:hypothetical protein
MKMAVFRVEGQRSLIVVYRRFIGTFCFHRQGDPDDGGSKYLWNVGKLLPHNAALQPRRQPSLQYPCEPYFRNNLRTFFTFFSLVLSCVFSVGPQSSYSCRFCCAAYCHPLCVSRYVRHCRCLSFLVFIVLILSL